MSDQKTTKVDSVVAGFESAWQKYLAGKRNSTNGQKIENLRDQIKSLLHGYRCQNTRDDEGNGLPLTDCLSPGDTIKEGIEEIALLADDLAAMVGDTLLTSFQRADEAEKDAKESIGMYRRCRERADTEKQRAEAYLTTLERIGWHELSWRESRDAAREVLDQYPREAKDQPHAL